MPRDQLYRSSLVFLDWLLFYEKAVLGRFGKGYREENYKDYSKVPKAKAWLEPEAALNWFKCFRESPDQLERPKAIARRCYA